MIACGTLKAFIVYGALIGAWSIIFLNGCLILVQLYFLFRHKQKRKYGTMTDIYRDT